MALWQRAVSFVGCLHAVASGGERGIGKGLDNAFPADDRPGQQACAHHRIRNGLAGHGTEALALFYKLVDAETAAHAAAINSSVAFTFLPDKQRKAILSAPDERQLPAATDAGGRKTLGKTATRAIEALNRRIMHATMLDTRAFSAMALCERTGQVFKIV